MDSEFAVPFAPLLHLRLVKVRMLRGPVRLPTNKSALTTWPRPAPRTSDPWIQCAGVSGVEPHGRRANVCVGG